VENEGDTPSVPPNSTVLDFAQNGRGVPACPSLPQGAARRPPAAHPRSAPLYSWPEEFHREEPPSLPAHEVRVGDGDKIEREHRQQAADQERHTFRGGFGSPVDDLREGKGKPEQSTGKEEADGATLEDLTVVELAEPRIEKREE
jgi:hypothetical protein